jgi:hypothetical protein
MKLNTNMEVHFSMSMQIENLKIASYVIGTLTDSMYNYNSTVL